MPAQKPLRVLLIVVPLLCLGGLGFFYKKTLFDFFERQTIRLTHKAGFTISNLFISGRLKTSKDSILRALNHPLGKPTLTLSLETIQRRLQRLPWVKKITIERHWPDTLFLHLKEKKAFALWQHKKTLNLIDEDGYVIHTPLSKDFSNLPTIRGPKAPKHLPRLLKVLHQFPELKAKLSSATWVGNRRWNLYTKNRIAIELTEKNSVAALKRFRKYEKNHKIIKEARKRIDLRIPQRIIIE